MNKKWLNLNRKVLLVPLWVGLFSVFFITTVFAATTTINTNDGSVDTNWSVVPMLSDDPNDDGDTYAEIDQVWIGNNSSLDTFYFRVDSLMQSPNNELLVAKLDCNQNDSYADAVDVAVIMDNFSSDAFECQGNTYNITCIENTGEEDSNGVASAEEINVGGGVYTYEWYGSTAGNVDWSSCLGTINVQFAAVSYNDYAIEDDTTVVRGYNAPTAIQMKELAATSGNKSGIFILATTVAMLFVSVWLLRRFYSFSSRK